MTEAEKNLIVYLLIVASSVCLSCVYHLAYMGALFHLSERLCRAALLVGYCLVSYRVDAVYQWLRD